MEYISVKEVAETWGVSERQVQRLLREERIAGAKRQGRIWLIPANAQKPFDMRRSETEHGAAHLSTPMRTVPMPLLNSRFEPGKGLEAIQAISDDDMQAIARVEYDYFRGDHQAAWEGAGRFLDHADAGIRISAKIVYPFSAFIIGKMEEAVECMKELKENTERVQHPEVDEQMRAMILFANMMVHVLLHMPLEKVPSLTPYIHCLPDGLKLMGAYVLAHAVYLRGDYGESLGIAKMALHMEHGHFVVPEIYLRMVMSMSLMNLMRIDEAKECFMYAWKLALPDGFFQPFGEHHGLLHGLIETCLKADYPEEYQKIISITYKQSAGWRKIHNSVLNASIADNLTTMEFTIAMLANRGWTNVEIADHLNLSEHTVKKYISEVYQKLGISSRKQLREFMLK